MYRILSISRNVRLLLSRNDAISLAGFSVITPRHPEQAAILASQERVDAVVIGHSIEPSLRKSVIDEVRAICPGCLVCYVYTAPDTSGEPLADVSLDVTRGTEPLITYLQKQLPREKAS